MSFLGFRFYAVALAVAAGCLPLAAAPAKDRRPVLAAFAHPDDERVVGPLLARLAREGREVHLVIATDGSKGVRDYAGIPAGPALVAKRAEEARCAADRLGIKQLHMLGMEDGSLGTSLITLAQLRSKLADVVSSVDPEIVITFGPDGGTGHPDHRLIGNVTTEVVQNSDRYRTTSLFYAGLPVERIKTAPPAIPRVSGVAAKLLTVRPPVSPGDIAAGQQSFACHWSQYSAPEMDAINKYLAHIWNGRNYLRPWNGADRKSVALFRL